MTKKSDDVVVDMSGYRYVPPNEYLVEQLEKLLRKAKSGEIQGFAMSYMYSDSSFTEAYTNISLGPKEVQGCMPAVTLLGSLRILTRHIEDFVIRVDNELIDPGDEGA